jgi:inner membrane protein
VDNVTHTLTGLMMARSGIDRKVPRAALMMMIAANLPDVDGIFIYRPELYLQLHRGYLHTLLFSPLMGLIPPLLFFAFKRQRITMWAWFFSWLGILSHIALDWTNAYGIRFLRPFSDHWFRLDMTDLFDPWILATLFLALAAPALASMVGAEIASSRKAAPGPKRGWAWFALIVMIGYEGLRYTSHERAIGEMNSHIYNGVIARRITAIPTGAGSVFKWKGIVEGPDFVQIVQIDLTQPFDPTVGRIEHPAPPGPAVDAAKASQPFQVFTMFDQVPFWKTTELEAGTQVELIDLRFGSPRSPGFEATAIVDASGAVHDARISFGRR